MCDSEDQHGDGGGRRLLVPYNGPEDMLVRQEEQG